MKHQVNPRITQRARRLAAEAPIGITTAELVVERAYAASLHDDVCEAFIALAAALANNGYMGDTIVVAINNATAAIGRHNAFLASEPRP